MAAILGTIRRNWLMTHPSEVPKTSKPLTFGILGAADIGPAALMLPAKSHPDVVVQTVAARDPAKAKAYAQKHGIPSVAQTYQDILDDPTIDCVYIPLPNGLHYEWALRSLEAGKHVLLEKPSVSNSTEAENLFSSSSLLSNPILLEATHPYFHPAWKLFMSHITPDAVVTAESYIAAPRGMFDFHNIRYDFSLGGGAMMDLGAYTASVLSHVFGGKPPGECLSCEITPSPTDPRCDSAYKARYAFPGGAVGIMEGDLRALPVGNRIMPRISVVHGPVEEIVGKDGGEGEKVMRTRKVVFKNFPQPTIFHSIVVEDEFVTPTKTWKESKTVKAYTGEVGEPHWTTYRYQLEQFVNKVRGRDVSEWVSGEDSVVTMRMIDMAYEKAGLPARPTSEYK
ncbi:hypothetical protein GGS20DRAFT_552547 [Poronia punctata]|nr:hypothetical protein GGS20DRAFT_552547 [Poronia punctata]